MHTLTNQIRLKIGLPTKELEKERGIKCLEGNFWGFPDGQDALPDGRVIFYEIEEGQAHPCTNVSKYWPVLEENPEMKIVLIQWLVKKPKSINRWRLAKFLANKMINFFPDRFHYFSLEFDINENRNQIEKIRQQIPLHLK